MYVLIYILIVAVAGGPVMRFVVETNETGTVQDTEQRRVQYSCQLCHDTAALSRRLLTRLRC